MPCGGLIKAHYVVLQHKRVVVCVFWAVDNSHGLSCLIREGETINMQYLNMGPS